MKDFLLGMKDIFLTLFSFASISVTFGVICWWYSVVHEKRQDAVEKGESAPRWVEICWIINVEIIILFSSSMLNIILNYIYKGKWNDSPTLGFWILFSIAYWVWANAKENSIRDNIKSYHWDLKIIDGVLNACIFGANNRSVPIKKIEVRLSCADGKTCVSDHEIAQDPFEIRVAPKTNPLAVYITVKYADKIWLRFRGDRNCWKLSEFES